MTASPDGHYAPGFYELVRDGTKRSASAVAPVLIEVFRPKSVVDVGCGIGLWLAAFRERGIEDVVGIDGPWVQPGQREIPPEKFRERDLAKPFGLDRTFDLAICLEVAEHLPAEAADAFIGELCKLSQVVVFSAAVPFQDGEGHVNEQWPGYWLRLFEAHGFALAADLRPKFWANPDVMYWYRQNILCFAAVERREAFDALFGREPVALRDIVHPELFLRVATEAAEARKRIASLSLELEVSRESHRRALTEAKAAFEAKLNAQHAALMP